MARPATSSAKQIRRYVSIPGILEETARKRWEESSDDGGARWTGTK